MCKVKTGKQITEMRDVQNLITASIFRAAYPYSIQSMIKEISRSCRGARIQITYEQIREMVEDTTTVFLRAGFISVRLGYYFADYSKEDANRLT